MAREGVRLVLADIERTRARRRGREAARAGARAEGVICDVSDRAVRLGARRCRLREDGRRAHRLPERGRGRERPGRRMTHDDWRWVIDVDLWG
jgi:hypothetical protein